MKYTGKKCVLCGEGFIESDDIVVCPVCGSPHHRECYTKSGFCANADYHDTEFDWNEENREIPKEEKIETFEDFQEMVDRKAENGTEDGSSTMNELMNFVHVNTLYYAPVFARIKLFNVSASFNIICFIFPPAYFANRKMWFWAVFTSFLSVLLLVPFMLSSFATYGSEIFSEKVMNLLLNNAAYINISVRIANFLDLIMRIFFCIFGNRLYYNFAEKSIKNLKFRAKEDITEEQLMNAGGINPLNTLWIMIITFFITFAVMFILQLGLEFLS